MDVNNSKIGDETMQDLIAQDCAVFDKTLVPHRSLNARGVNIVIACIGVVGFCASLPFFILGAWPVAGFFGLDVFLLYIAFRANMRSARAYERIVMTYFNIIFKKVSAKGREQLWHFTPIWTGVKIDTHEEFGVQQVVLVQKNKEIEVASFLGAEEKAEFATSFKSALLEARRGPTYNY
jgi:uncharacterized membrane protein